MNLLLALLVNLCFRFNWIGNAWEWLESRPLARRMRRQEEGLCEACGYDIRASPRRCPECGHPVSPTARMFIEYRRKREAGRITSSSRRG